MGTGVIVQARLGSSRLPGKVLARLGDDSVLRCARTIPGVDVVCCAIPDTSEDDWVAIEAQRAGAIVFRGAETDVLDRYFWAARTLNLDVVLRITADCPLIDPVVCGAVLALLRETGVDYASNNDPPSWPHGLDCEAISRKWLARAWAEAAAPWQREHVTPYIRSHPEANRANWSMPGGAVSKLRWTIDHPCDLAALRAVVARLPKGPAGWSYRSALAVCEADPALAKLNAGFDRLEGLKRSMGEAA